VNENPGEIKHLAAIVGGSIAGGLILILLVVFLVVMLIKAYNKAHNEPTVHNGKSRVKTKN
jgi:hypothetical protein